MGTNIVDKSFYLTSIFANIKSDHRWTTNETKMVLLLFKELSKYKIFLPDLDGFNDTVKELQQRIKNVPVIYEFDKKDFQAVTGVRREHLAREIKKVSKGLLSKVIVTPHPLKPNDTNSFKAFSWFTDIEYINSEGTIKLKVNDSAIERLVAFVKYSHINFEYVINIQNHNAIHTYLTLKILIDSTHTRNLLITIDEYKQKLGLEKKYRNLSEFRKYVLDVVYNEINEYTDMIFSYTLIKEGRAFTKIRFDFDYKTLLPKEKVNEKSQLEEKLEYYEDGDQFSIFETQLTSWGIRAKTIVELEEKYSLDAIFQSIEITKKAIDEGIIKGTPAAYFKGVLENTEFEAQKMFEEQQAKRNSDQEALIKAARALEIENTYEAILKDTNLYDEEISKYLSAKSMGAIIELSEKVAEFIENISNIDPEQFNGYKPKFAALEIGYFDYNKEIKIRPNMYDFLKLFK